MSEKSSSSTPEFGTVVGSQANLTGDLKVEGSIKILGSVDGKVECTGHALVCNGANIKGELKADSVTVEGQVKANVAAKKVELKPKAKLEGDLRANRLDVAEGSEFIGQCHVGTHALEPARAVEPTHLGKPVLATVKS
jgi:cytoskeletal protein CcmA (bactofilin family)